MSERRSTAPQDWQRRYEEDDVPWDLGRAPPVLERLIAERADAVAGSAEPPAVLVPGAGRGHDARAWARAGYAVTALDIAPTAVAQGRALDAAEGVPVAWVEGDLLALPPSFAARFDLVWEQTCLCALPPERREEYVRVMARVLRPGGTWLGVLWEVGRPDGPPWSLAPGEVAALLEPAFEIVRVQDVPPWTDVRWDEFVVEARRLPDAGG